MTNTGADLHLCDRECTKKSWTKTGKKGKKKKSNNLVRGMVDDRISFLTSRELKNGIGGLKRNPRECFSSSTQTRKRNILERDAQTWTSVPKKEEKY